MFNFPRKFRQQLIFLLSLPLLVWTMTSLAGCGGNKNIPPSSILRSSKVTLMWKDVAGAVAYNVYLSTSPDVTVLNSFKIPNATNPITITDLEPDATYYFMVTVEDGSGQIRKSKEISYKVVDTVGSIQLGDVFGHSLPRPAVPNSNPAVKTPVSKTNDITLAWNEVPNATSYNIYWSNKPGVTKKNGTKIANVKSPYKMTGLKKGKKYYFIITAVNASGESKESKEISSMVK
jgi:fibronectin type 3 domain-containing protein